MESHVLKIRCLNGRAKSASPWELVSGGLKVEIDIGITDDAEIAKNLQLMGGD